MPTPALKPERDHRVLVVEDEHRVCELLEDVLTEARFEADCVTSDRVAYESLRHRGPYACMIVDVNLGSGTTGFDVARFAREIDPALPVIYVSGQTTRQSVLANGVAGSLFVEKPFAPAELLEAVRTLVGHNDD